MWQVIYYKQGMCRSIKPGIVVRKRLHVRNVESRLHKQGMCRSIKPGIVVRKTFACKQCGKSFTQARNVQKHQTRHCSKKTFACKECGKSFAGAFSGKTCGMCCARSSQFQSGKRKLCQECGGKGLQRRRKETLGALFVPSAKQVLFKPRRKLANVLKITIPVN